MFRCFGKHRTSPSQYCRIVESPSGITLPAGEDILPRLAKYLALKTELRTSRARKGHVSTCRIH